MEGKKVLIIGGGPAGTSAAMAFVKRNMDVTLVEKSRIGGVCVSTGCVPTRAYLQAIKHAEATKLLDDSLADYRIPSYKLRASVKHKIDQVSFGSEYMLRKLGVKLLSGEAKILDEHTVEVNGETIRCDELVLATGSKPAHPAGISCRREFTAERLLSLTDLPRKLAIIGGGILGVEMAVILNYFGVQVTIYEKEASILPGWDEDIQRVMRAYLKKSSIEIVESSKENAFGDALFACGCTAEKNIQSEHVHYIGDAAGHYFTADLAMEEGTRLAEKMESRERSSLECGSACVFTPLEAATTGLRKQDGENLKEGYLEIGYYGTGRIFDVDTGFIKVVMEQETHVLKGFHIVSSLASEIIQIGQMAVTAGLTAEEFCQMVFPHPTEGELLKEAVRTLL